MTTAPEIQQLIRSRRKTIALIIQRDGALIVRAPLRAPEKTIRELVAAKADWIRAKQAQLQAAPAPAQRKFQPGETLPFLGKYLPLVAAPPTRPLIHLAGDSIRLSSAASAPREAFTRWYKAQAAAYFEQRVAALAQHHRFQYTKLRITSARTRWGSCSSKGTLSFTWRLVMASPEVIDYVIIHELAHLKVRNHSEKFWALVATLMPGYKTHVQWLKKHGQSLEL